MTSVNGKDTRVAPRKRIFQLRLSEQEHDLLRQKSLERGITASELLRDLVKSLSD